MNKRRLFSSKEIVAALECAGFEQHRTSSRSGGSHCTLKRLRSDGRHDVATVVLGKKEVPWGTFNSILTQANMSYEEFLEFAKVKRKGK